MLILDGNSLAGELPVGNLSVGPAATSTPPVCRAIPIGP
jgi:hypothetical protein